MAMTAQEKREARAARVAAQKAETGTTEAEQLNEALIRNPTAAPSAHGEVAAPSRGATVTVGCKVGVSGIDLQLCQIIDKKEQSLQGERTVKESIRVGDVVRIKGTARPRGTAPDGFPESPLIVAGAAMTPGVDKEWFDEWLRQNARNPLVMNGMIFAHENPDHVAGIARETEAIKSGLDPIDPRNMLGDRRLPRPNRPEIAKIEDGTASRRAASGG